MTDTQYDLVVIGAGPGGYVAAIRAAQLGMKVACVDKRPNIGRDLSQCWLHSRQKRSCSRLRNSLRRSISLAEHGVKIGKVGLDLDTMLARKDDVVDGLTKGIAFLFKKNKIDQITGSARITAPDTVEVSDPASVTLKTQTNFDCDRLGVGTSARR